MSDQVKITYYGLYREANRLLDKSKISLGEYERMIEPLNDEIRKAGRWIDAGWDGEKCSLCGWNIDDTFYTQQFNYCPNCGAKMEERR